MKTQNVFRQISIISYGLYLFMISNCYASDQLGINPFNFDIKTIDRTSIDDILSMESNQYLYQTCQNWHLSKQQIKQFFMLSERYTYSPYSMYYQVPCNITGTLVYQKEIWQFTINGGATAMWLRKGVIKYFGCHDIACKPLVIIPTDDMKE